MGRMTEFKDMTGAAHGNRSLEEAISEIEREVNVRKRMYDKWVSEGKFSWVDGSDRMERILSALRWLQAIPSNKTVKEMQDAHAGSTAAPIF